VRDWVLTTAVVQDTPYYRDITPLTFPLMERYADKWDMDFEPCVLRADDTVHDHPAPAGTEADYRAIPFRQMLLRAYEGVVFVDSDLVVVEDREDICLTVDDQQPIGFVNGCGLVVMRAGDIADAFLSTIWALRRNYLHLQWLEQAAFMHLIGWEHAYQPGRPLPTPKTQTAWSPFVRELEQKWNFGPVQAQMGLVCEDPHFLHPLGVQPYEYRLDLVRQFVALAADVSP
jgi:hypothetical protein